MAVRGGGTRRRIKQGQACDRIREAILSGYFRLGERLGEEDLALRLGMSRTPVREALHRLSQEGLVQDSPETGWSVVDFTCDDVRDLYQVRANLEGMAARLAAEIRPEREMEELAALALAADQAAACGESQELQRIQQRFHLALARASGNGLLSDLLANLAVRAGLTMSIGLRRGERKVESTAEHRRILDAIVAGRGAAAEIAARDHMAHAMETVVQGLSGRVDLFARRGR